MAVMKSWHERMVDEALRAFPENDKARRNILYKDKGQYRFKENRAAASFINKSIKENKSLRPTMNDLVNVTDLKQWSSAEMAHMASEEFAIANRSIKHMAEHGADFIEGSSRYEYTTRTGRSTKEGELYKFGTRLAVAAEEEKLGRKLTAVEKKRVVEKEFMSAHGFLYGTELQEVSADKKKAREQIVNMAGDRLVKSRRKMVTKTLGTIIEKIAPYVSRGDMKDIVKTVANRKSFRDMWFAIKEDIKNKKKDSIYEGLDSDEAIEVFVYEESHGEGSMVDQFKKYLDEKGKPYVMINGAVYGWDPIARKTTDTLKDDLKVFLPQFFKERIERYSADRGDDYKSSATAFSEAGYDISKMPGNSYDETIKALHDVFGDEDDFY